MKHNFKIEPASPDWLRSDQYFPPPEPACGAIVDLVQREISFRARRGEFLPPRLFADPAWDMLLDLYHAELRHKRVTVSNLCVASLVPSTTALRWLRILETHGLIERNPDPLDGRRIYVLLTAHGKTAMASYFASRHSTTDTRSDA